MPARTTLATSLLALSLAFGAAPGQADGNAGAYLAARIAATENDYRAAAEYFTRALVLDPSNVGLLEGALSSHVSAGDPERAVPIATRIIQTAPTSQLANLVLVAEEAQEGDWEDLLAGLEAGQSVGPLFDGLARAWALVGAGRMNDALAAFDEVAANPGVGAFGLYHKALALAAVGDFEGAAEMFSGAAGPQVRLTRRGTLAYVEVLSQIDRGAEAVGIIDQTFGPDLDDGVAELRRQLAAGAPVPYQGITSAREGIAETAFSIAGALNGEAADGYTLVYARIAEYLDPGHVDAVLLSASLLNRLGQYDLATEAFAAVPADHPFFHVAELGRAEALRNAGDVEGGIAALTALSESHPDIATVHVALGDMLRREERFAEATPAYDRAIALFGEPEEAQWVVYFSKALELRPDQPQVLNYLGYSMVEMQVNLEEALSMIERAVAAEPESGYIVDSLGWVLYRLGRYDEALVHMERAVELLHRHGGIDRRRARPHPPQARDRARRGPGRGGRAAAPGRG